MEISSLNYFKCVHLFLLLRLTTGSSINDTPQMFLDSILLEHKSNINIVSDLLRHAVLYNVSNISKCERDINYFGEALISQHKLWALKMVDSSSVLQPGFLEGNIIALGAFDECLDMVADNGAFTGRHCLVSPTHIGDLPSLLTLLPLPMVSAICIPSSCSAAQMELFFNDYFNGSLILKIESKNCAVKESKPFEVVEICAMFIFISVVGIAVCSTCYDMAVSSSTKKSKLHEIVISFSVITNCRKLLQIAHNRDQLDCIHGLRFLSIAWVVCGHKTATIATGPIMNLSGLPEFLASVSRVHLINAHIAVDTFFVLSGSLLSFVFLKMMKNEGGDTKPFNVLVFYLHRYLRLTPALAAMALFQATLFARLCYGPLCPLASDVIVCPCIERWWSTLLYINNYLNPLSSCLYQSWYLAVDTQFYCLSPLILYPLLHWPHWARYQLGAVIICAVGTAITVPYYYQLPAAFQFYDTEMRDYVNRLNYVPMHTRAGPWLIGILLGVILRDCKSGNGLLLKPWMVRTGWVLSAVLCLASLYGIFPFQQPTHVYSRLWDSLYLGLHRNLWAIGIAWVIFACSLGHGGAVNTFLSWHLFQPLSRLCYCIYLVHPAVIYAQFGTTRTPLFYSDLTQFTSLLGDICLSVMMAAVLSLLFEAPILGLEKSILRPEMESQKHFTQTQRSINGSQNIPTAIHGICNSGLLDTGSTSAIFDSWKAVPHHQY